MIFYFMNIMTLRIGWDWTQKYRFDTLATIIGGSLTLSVQAVIIFCYKYPSFVSVKRMTRLTKANEANYKQSWIKVKLRMKSSLHLGFKNINQWCFGCEQI